MDNYIYIYIFACLHSIRSCTIGVVVSYFECCRWTRVVLHVSHFKRDGSINVLVPVYDCVLYFRPTIPDCTLAKIVAGAPRFIAAEKLEFYEWRQFTRCWCVLDDRTEKCDYSMTNPDDTEVNNFSKWYDIVGQLWPAFSGPCFNCRLGVLSRSNKQLGISNLAGEG